LRIRVCLNFLKCSDFGYNYLPPFDRQTANVAVKVMIPFFVRNNKF